MKMSFRDWTPLQENTPSGWKKAQCQKCILQEKYLSCSKAVGLFHRTMKRGLGGAEIYIHDICGGGRVGGVSSKT